MRISERRVFLTVYDLLALNEALPLRPGYSYDLGLVVRQPLWVLVLNAIWFPVAWALDA